jgi:N-acetylmuramoyl-L-alanine amidase
MFKKAFILATCFAAITVCTSFTKEKKQKVLRTIVIDAGHGGHDGGARGVYSSEKDICLGVAMKLGQAIERELPDVKVIYTRTSDIYPELHARAKQANQNKGDLFISIHVNAAPPVQHKEFTGYKTVTSYTGKGKKKKKVTRKVPQYRYYSTPNPAKGTETYIWGAHKNEDKEVAIRDIDPNSPEFIALSLLKTKQFFKRSATLAGFVEEQFTKVGRISRGQKQRQVGIWVLQATAMPSILVETGYITNRSEEDYLNSESGQKEIANCITVALKSYVTWLEKNQTQTDKNAHLPQPKQDAYKFLQEVDAYEKKRLSR